jgi:hypothetical protein
MDIATFEIEKPVMAGKTSNIEYLLKLNNIYILSINKSPLGDCQTYTISKMIYICKYDNWIDILKEIQNNIKKNQLLFNVNNGNSAHVKLKEFFKDDIVFENTYLSTYGTNMTMMLVKTTKLKE